MSALAQQRPQYTQYVMNNFLLNPATAGVENYTDVKLGYRSQWSGIEGAPVSSYLTVNAPLGTEFTQGDAAGAEPMGGESPYSRMYTAEYRAAAPHHGLGFSVITDKAARLEQTDIAVAYAYHLGITPSLNLAVGVSAGAGHLHLQTSELNFENPDDPILRTLENNKWRPNAGVGIWAYSGNYFVGVSAQQLVSKAPFISSQANGLRLSRAVPHYFATAGIRCYVSDDVSLLPSALLKFVDPAPASFDLNLKISFRDRFWFGGSYRHNDAMGILAGINVNSLINVGYSYDANTSALRNVSNGSHELVLSILLNNRYRVTCPRHNW